MCGAGDVDKEVLCRQRGQDRVGPDQGGERR